MSSNGDAPRTRVEQTFEAIRDDIVSGALAPDERLGVDKLRERYGVGASTIREALSLLSADALVIAEGQRGFRVAPLSSDDLAELSDARKLLETYALRESIAKGDDDWEADVVATFHRLSRAQQRLDEHADGAVAEWELRNREFHEALVSRCSSRWIHFMLDTLNHHSERYRRAALAAESPVRDVHAEHRDLMESAIARDADRAERCIREHIDNTVTVVSDSNPATPGTRT